MRRYITPTPRPNHNSIIVKYDVQPSDHTSTQADLNSQLTYDLEIQKPVERIKILTDDEYFRKLSLSFYADFKKESKSYSPQRYTEESSYEKGRKPEVSINADLISSRAHISGRADNILSSRASNIKKDFQIRTHNNVNQPTDTPRAELHTHIIDTRKSSCSPSPRNGHKGPISQLKEFLSSNFTPRTTTRKADNSYNFLPRARVLDPSNSVYKTNTKMPISSTARIIKNTTASTKQDFSPRIPKASAPKKGKIDTIFLRREQKSTQNLRLAKLDDKPQLFARMVPLTRAK